MLRRWGIAALFSIGCCSGALADNLAPEVISPAPWCTGPLLAYSGVTAPLGTANFQVFYLSTKVYRTNNFYSQAPQLDLTVGLAKRMDLEVITTYTFNSSAGHQYHGFDDLNALLTFQAVPAQNDQWYPALRLALIETLPTGKFDGLDPGKLQVDITGQGVYQTGLGAFFVKYYDLHQDQWLNAYLTLIYTAPASTHVSGYNSYGGSSLTEGREENGGGYYADFALEYALNRHWVITGDITYNYSFRDSYRGFLGIAQDGSVSDSNNPATEVVTLAPGIEYNFNEKLGLLAGVWFSVYEHNLSNFVTGIVSLNYLIG